MKALLTSILLLLTAASVCPAQDKEETLRPVTAAWSLEAGAAHLADTYLTPLRYKGYTLGLGYERFQAMRFAPEQWIMRLEAGASLALTHNPAHNADMSDISGHACWGMMRRWRAVLPGLTLAAGGSTALDLGALYLRRNGNNPVSVKASWSLALTGMACWTGRLLRRPLTLRWQPTLPLTGLFFSPDYGELYYEIYLGNHSGLVHVAWPANRFALQNLLTADWRLGSTALRLGYRNDIVTTRVNNLTTRRIFHTAVIGFSGEFLSLSPSRALSPAARIVSAFY